MAESIYKGVNLRAKCTTYGMSNITKVEIPQSILTLKSKGWSVRRIARKLGVHRVTGKTEKGKLTV